MQKDASTGPLGRRKNAYNPVVSLSPEASSRDAAHLNEFPIDGRHQAQRLIGRADVGEVPVDDDDVWRPEPFVAPFPGSSVANAATRMGKAIDAETRQDQGRAETMGP